MTIKICIANPKGGTGKTSCAVNLSSALALHKKRVLLCDLDPQCSATVALGLLPGDDAHSLAEVLISGNDPKDCIMRYHHGSLDVMVANSDLTVVPVALYNQENGHKRLQEALSEIEDDYDIIIVDTPASLSILNINAFCACDYLLIPTSCDYFALDSMQTLLSFCAKLQGEDKSSITLLGILRTLYDDKSPLCTYISQELKSLFENSVFDSVISFNSRISEASASGECCLSYDRSSISSMQYLSLATEILNRLKNCSSDFDL